MHDPSKAPFDKPTVVQAITRLNIGGPGRHVLAVAAGLTPHYEIRVAAGTAPTVEGELPSGSVPIDRLPMVRSVDPRSDLAALVGMRRLLHRHRPSIVHSHMAKAGSVARLGAASMRPRPRTVHTFHGHVLAGYFRPRTEAFFASAERRLARHTDVLLTVSADVRDALLELGIGTPAQYEVVPLGVDFTAFRTVDRPTGALRRTLGIPDDVPLVGVPARLVPVKDHATFFDAMAQLAGVHAVVLGDGELRSGLEARVRDLGLADRVHFAGWWEDMASALADVDVVALTSRNEGTPMALIEASGACCPVVATRVGGTGDVVQDGRTGTLVPRGEPGAIAGAIRDLLADPALRQRYGRAGRVHVQERFGMQRSLETLQRLYDDLIGTTPRRRRRSQR